MKHKRLAIFTALAVCTHAAVATSLEQQLEFLRTVCVSSGRVDYKVGLGGGLTVLLRGARGSATFTKEEVVGVNKALAGEQLAADLRSQRECMAKYAGGILAKVAVAEPRAPSEIPRSQGAPATGPRTTPNRDFAIPRTVDRMFAFSQRVGPSGSIEESVEWPSMSRDKFPTKIDALMAYSRQQSMKLVIAARTKDENWGIVNSITYREKPLTTQAYFNPGVKTVHEGKEVPLSAR